MIIKADTSNPNEAGEPRPAAPRIKDMDAQTTPRERAETLGVGALTLTELWAIILRTGTKGYPITTLCRDLMRSNDDRLTTLERRTNKELRQIKGLGPLKAMQVEAVMEIVRRYNREEPADNPVIHSSSDIYDVIRTHIAHLEHEEVWIMIMNQRHEVVKLFQASRGGWASTLFDVKVIIKEAMLENAAAIAMCHNHPSGNLRPSPQDDNITEKCVKACKAVEIQFLDHVIATTHGYYSYHDHDRLPR